LYAQCHPPTHLGSFPDIHFADKDPIYQVFILVILLKSSLLKVSTQFACMPQPTQVPVVEPPTRPTHLMQL